MALPKQIEQQQKELEVLEKQLMAQNEAKPVEETEPKSEDPPVEKLPEEPKEAQPVEEEKPPQPVPQEVPDDMWQQKYKTLEGKYSAEVPRLHAQIKDLMAKVEELQQTKKPEPEPEKFEVQKLVTDADVEAFGSDLIEVQRKVAREVAQEFKKDLDELRSENKRLQDQLLKTGGQIGEVTFEQRLHRLVPDFAQVNADPRWVAWLDETDPIIRGPRRVMAQSAFEQGDAEAVKDYVELFKKTLGEPVEDKRKTELERQVQPTKSVSSTPPNSQKGRTYTTKDIERMFEKVGKLNATQKFDEAQKLEAEIDAAYMEGRVTA